MVKSTYSSSGPSCQHLFPVSVGCTLLQLFPFTLDGMLVHCRVTPKHYIFWYPFKHQGGVRHCESKVSCTRTHHSDPSKGLKLGPLTMRSSHLFNCAIPENTCTYPHRRDFLLRPPALWKFQLASYIFSIFGPYRTPHPQEIPISFVVGVWIFSGTAQIFPWHHC